MDEKKVTAKEFLAADKPLRDALLLLSKLFAHHARKSEAELKPHFEKVEQHFKEVADLLTNLCKGR
jgi:hypothetical protein